MKPEISVIISALNEEGCIGNTLECFKNQRTRVPFEVIVCDGYSKDKTVAIAKKYNARVVYEAKRSIAAAKNTAAKYAKGKYLVHTDADTIYPSNFIEEAYKIFKSNKYVAFTCGHWNYSKDEPLHLRIFAKIFGLAHDVYWRIQQIKNTLTLPGWCICTPKRIFDAVGGFQSKVKKCEDVLYSYAVELLGKKAYFPHINVRSSVRRFRQGLFSTIKHYSKMGHGIKELAINLLRKTFYKEKRSLN